MTKIFQPWESLATDGEMSKSKPITHAFFRERLKALREASRMDGDQLEEKLKKAGIGKGASASSVYRWESDGELPRLDILIALATIYGVPIESLVSDPTKTPLASSVRGDMETAILIMAKEMEYPKAIEWLAKGLKEVGGLKGQPGTEEQTSLDDVG